MKNTVSIIICFLLIAVCLTACGERTQYTPTGEFYIKTSPSRGDGGEVNVISIEAERKTYEGDGDITVPMTVGLGHLPTMANEYDGTDTFYVLYQVVKVPLQENEASVTAWEKRVEYSDSWYDAKYNSTEQVNRPFLIFSHYGQFYPIYKETVEIVFPADVENGTLEVEACAVLEGEEDPYIMKLSFSFHRIDGVLTLDPKH